MTMSEPQNPSLGKQPDTATEGQELTTRPQTFDATTPINAATWQRAEAFRIAGTLNTCSGFKHDKMTADFDNGLISKKPEEIGESGVFHAESELFIGEWFDPDLDGKPGIVHGADLMYTIGKLVDELMQTEIEDIEEIRFNSPIKNAVNIFIITREGRRIQSQEGIKPIMTAKVRMRNGQTVEIQCFDKGEGDPITKRSASNTFVQHICIKPLTQHAAAIKWAQQNEKDFTPPESFEVELKALPSDQQAAFAKFYAKNPNGITGSTALDIVITATQVLAALGEEAGGIRQENSLGAGFQNVTLPPAHKLITGCRLRLTPQRNLVRKTEKAEFWPIQFVFLDNETNQPIGEGIFNWVNRLNI